MKSHHKKEFIHRKELSKSPFNLDLSDVELWDLVKIGRLQPFTKIQPSMQYFPTDPLSRDPAFEAMFPRPIAEKYKRLRDLQQQIAFAEEFINRNEDEAWGKFQLDNSKKLEDKDDKELALEKESFLAFNRNSKEKVSSGGWVNDPISGAPVQIQSLEAYKREAAELKKEFKDLPKLYEEYINNMESDSQREYFVEKLNNTYYRRDHIKGVIEVRPRKKRAEPSSAAAQKRKVRYHREKKKFIYLYERFLKLDNSSKGTRWFYNHRVFSKDPRKAHKLHHPGKERKPFVYKTIREWVRLYRKGILL